MNTTVSLNGESVCGSLTSNAYCGTGIIGCSNLNNAFLGSLTVDPTVNISNCNNAFVGASTINNTCLQFSNAIIDSPITYSCQYKYVYPYQEQLDQMKADITLLKEELAETKALITDFMNLVRVSKDN